LHCVATLFIAAHPAHKNSDKENDEQDPQSHWQITFDFIVLSLITADDPIAFLYIPLNLLYKIHINFYLTKNFYISQI